VPQKQQFIQREKLYGLHFSLLAPSVLEGHACSFLPKLLPEISRKVIIMSLSMCIYMLASKD